MKKISIIAIALLTGVFGACTVQETLLSDSSFTFRAVNGDAPGTKTVLEGGKSVLWCPNDQINVFYGKASGCFVSTNTEVAATAVFKGDLPGIKFSDTDFFWAVYPYSRETTFDGSAVTLTVPAVQTAVEGTFADDLFPSLALSSGTDLTFYNLCGGIKFSLAIEGVKYIVFSGNDSESLAGKVRVVFNKDNKPIPSESSSTEKAITVNAPTEDGYFKTDVWYYLVSLPRSLTKGYQIALFGDDDKLLDTKEGGPASIERSVWGVLSNLGKKPDDPVNP